MARRRLLLALAILCSWNGLSAQNIIIPKPDKAEFHEGSYTLKKDKVFIEDKSIEKDLQGMIREKMPKTGSISFLTDSSLGKDCYVLEVSKKGIVSKASGYGGHFYALQTLLQITDGDKIPCCRIEDGPRFGWRGVLLDVARHWFSKEDVERYIDELATYKMNVFHWHLSDDQGWRIQIDAYPRLTEVSAFRTGEWWSFEPLQEPYGGFYTKDDIREVIEYARVRNITVMPEIDVPGHSLSELVAYPELACQEVPEQFNFGTAFYEKIDNALCPGNEATFQFLDGLFKEIAELFPCEYIDIGGDECTKVFWEKCDKCKKRMEEEHLSSTDELQSYFIKRVEKIVNKYGKRLVGWDEILEGGLAEDATVMSWRGMEGGITAAKAGHQVIMTPTKYCYIDLYQGEPSVEPCTYSMLRLSTAYSFEPVPEGVDAKYILGGQANLWTESVPSIRHAEYMTWPRTWAISESLWTDPQNKDWMDFVDRVEKHFVRLHDAGINCADRSMYNAIVTLQKDGKIRLESEIDDVQMHYTFDNTNPDEYCPKYEAPLTIPKNACWLKVQSYRHGKMVGDRLTFVIKDMKAEE